MTPIRISLPHLRTVAGFGLLSVLGACGDDGTSPIDDGLDEPAAFQLQVLSVGTYHTCGLTAGGKAYCWGQNTEGQLGDGTTTNRVTPVAVEGALVFKTIVAGGTHTCGITTGGVTYCWGLNHRGQLGEGPVVQTAQVTTATIRTVPGSVTGGLQFTSLSLGGAYTCGLTAEGAAYCWGGNAQGNFGNDKEVVDGACALSGLSQLRPDPYCWRPVPAARGLTLRTLVAGSFHACGLTVEGRVYCWGVNQWGQIGDRTMIDRLTPVPVALDLRYEELAGGQSYMCAVRAAIAYCWGALPWGRLFGGSFNPFNDDLYKPTVPTMVAPEMKLDGVSVGYEVACALTDDDATVCWGDNPYGQLGDGTTGVHRMTPEPIVGGRTFQRLVAGYQRVCGLTADGSVYCWGRNDQGQLGDGTTVDRSVPVAVVRGP